MWLITIYHCGIQFQSGLKTKLSERT